MCSWVCFFFSDWVVVVVGEGGYRRGERKTAAVTEKERGMCWVSMVCNCCGCVVGVETVRER